MIHRRSKGNYSRPLQGRGITSRRPRTASIIVMGRELIGRTTSLNSVMLYSGVRGGSAALRFGAGHAPRSKTSPWWI
jgi:hypothetical protein